MVERLDKVAHAGDLQVQIWRAPVTGTAQRTRALASHPFEWRLFGGAVPWAIW